jgi:hypothetical protein
MTRGVVLWGLCRPVLGLALLAAGCMIIATLLLTQADATRGLLVSVASLLAGVALLASIVAAVELYLALLGWMRWSAGRAVGCAHCGWPVSLSIVLSGRCLNPEQSHRQS